jgi:hypothetical protein
MEDHISKEEFLYQFFGNFGREFGNPKQWFVNDPTQIFSFIEYCKINKLPAFMSVQPRKAHYQIYGLEKIFFDFDYADKTFIKNLDAQIILKEISESDKEEILSERKKALPLEVKRFVNKLMYPPEDSEIYPLTPLIIQTNKGYHVYIYFDTVYGITNDNDFWCQVYGNLYRRFYKDGENYRFIDTTSEDDIFRMSRIPFSIHEKSGIECVIVDNNLKPTKIRGLGNYKLAGLKQKDLFRAVTITREINQKKAYKDKLRKLFEPKISINFNGKDNNIRPCFKKALDYKEMPNKMRLAFLLELWYKKNYHTVDELTEPFRILNDFDEKKTRYYIKWFLDHEVYNYRPYRCAVMMKENWCLQDKCPKYQYQKK